MDIKKEQKNMYNDLIRTILKNDVNTSHGKLLLTSMKTKEQ